MNLSLYEITAELVAIVESEEEMTDQDLQRLDGLMPAIETKAVNISALTDKMEAFVDLCKKEETRIAAKRKAVENKTNSLKTYLKECMERAGIMKIEQGTVTLALQKNPPKVIIDDERKVPAEYITVIPEQYQPNKNAIKEAIKSGKKVAGCHLEQSLSLRKR